MKTYNLFLVIMSVGMAAAIANEEITDATDIFTNARQLQ